MSALALVALLVAVVALQAPAATAVGLGSGSVSHGLESGRRGGPCDPGGSHSPLLEIHSDGRFMGCTHGADAVAPGIDLGDRPSTSELRERAAPDGTAVSCVGDGTSGYRVQAIYAYPAGQPNRYAEVAPLIEGWAASNAEAVIEASAAETGGGRLVRFVTDPACRLVITPVQLSAAGDDGFGNTIAELRQRGFDRSDRKYLVWMDAAGPHCAIAELYPDDSPGPENLHNGNPGIPGMVGRIDAPCWGNPGTPFEAHELMHLLGGVQYSAPHATGGSPGGHCTDEADVMCYDDDGDEGATVSWVCPGQHERLFDCGDDDYFSTAPPPGSYLAGHWNAATNRFLEPAPGPVARHLTLRASRRRVTADRRIRLTTSILPCGQQASRRIELRWSGRMWVRSSNLQCRATFRVRVLRTSTFRAVSSDPYGGPVASKRVTVRVRGR